jgi:hypothetical protein
VRRHPAAGGIVTTEGPELLRLIGHEQLLT